MNSPKTLYERWSSQRTATKIAQVLGATLVGYEVNRTLRHGDHTSFSYFNKESGNLMAGEVKDNSNGEDGPTASRVAQIAGRLTSTGEFHIETSNIRPRRLRKLLRRLRQDSETRLSS